MRLSSLRLFVLCAAVAAGPVLGAAAHDPVVAVSGGKLKGRMLPSGAAVFKGIPFAQPPTGDLRWRPPVPGKSWSGIREARDYGPTCAQIAAGWNDRAAAKGSEDCLYLNVWTPAWPARVPRPVMLWIHGGGNMGGSALGSGGIEPPFDGEGLARKGAVVVTVNYRLGVFGFTAHPALTAESPHRASGNYGLLDQIAALRWVRADIARFGGDPGNVTIFGQSAGAQDIGLLMTSPLARGLFHRAIAESGTVIIRGRLTVPLAQAEQAGVILGERLNVPASGALHYMRSLPTAAVLRASPAYGERGPLRPEPNVDGYVLPRLPAAVFKAGEEMPVPLIIGNNAREQLLPGGTAELAKAIAEHYGDLAPRASRLYSPGGEPGHAPYPPYGDAGAQFWTDTAFRCPADTIAGWRKQPTFQYEFSRGFEPRGAAHSFELRYVFGVFPGAPEDLDRRLSDQIQRYWINFALAGDPNGTGLPKWPRLVPGRREYLELGTDGTTVKSGLRVPFCDLFREKLRLTP